MANKNDTNCPITVAIAPPATPLLNTKINIGSKIILIIAPITNNIIAYLGEPSALIILDNDEYIIIKGAPIQMILPYSTAYLYTFSVHPNSITNLGIAI